MYFKKSHVHFFQNPDKFLSLKALIILANSVDPDEMQYCAA